MPTIPNRAQVLFGPKDLKLIERPISPPDAEEVQVEIKATTLCGSDVHYFSHYCNGDIRIQEPLSQGHEASGIITGIGAAVAERHSLQPGDRVALEVGVPCDRCEECLDGRYNVCESMRFRSSAASFPHYQGTLQERLNHPAKWVHKLPDSMTYAEGALLEPLAVAIHAVEKANAKDGASCLIIGAGAVGLLCAAAAKASGYRHVVVADIAQNRLDFASENGFADAVQLLAARGANSLEQGLKFAREDALELTAPNPVGKFHVSFECSGVESCVRTAIHATRGGGKVILVGMGTPVQTLPVSAAALREVDLVGVWRYANCYPRGIELMQAFAVDESLPDVRKIITHHFQGLQSVPEAFDTAARTKDQAGRLVIKTVVEM